MGQMRVVQLGCGITGLVCAEYLEKNPKVDELVLADMRTDAAEGMARRVRSDKISVVKTDASDKNALKKLLRGTDLVVCSITSELLGKIGEAAIASGVNYLDFSLSVDFTKKFEALRRKCSDSGMTYITAMGADPGMSDVFARYGAGMLDSAYEAHVRDGDNATAEGYGFFTLWSPLDMVEEATTPAAVCKNGKISYLPPLFKKEIYEFPQPIGALPVYNTTHEETFLIPRFIKGIKNADFKIAIDDEFAAKCNMLRKIGMHSKELVNVKGTMVRPLDVVVATMPRPVELVGMVKGSAGIVVEILGEKNGKDVMAKVWATLSHEEAYRICKSNATGYLVGAAGAVGAEMMISGELKNKGLLVPEQLPAKKFIERLPSKRLEAKSKIISLK
ncbi:MAG: saccharopine dehydrogenase C-terminal domain-containing protein [Thermoplasmata archaeon]